MIKKFIIGRYRGIENLELDDLKNVNIFVGPNNCGKTSILEAIILSGVFEDVDLLVDTLVSRYHGFSTEYFESLFPVGREPVICLKSRLGDGDKLLHTHLTYNKSQMISKDDSANVSNTFELRFSYHYEGNSQQDETDKFLVRFEETKDNYRISFAGAPENKLNCSIPCKFISFSRFDRSERLLKDIDTILDQNLRDELIEVLKIFDSEIVNFEVIGKNRTIKLFKAGQENPLTLYDFGNGMYKAFFIATSALLSQDGILLVDEIEAGIHSKALAQFISKLLEVCDRKNVQLFLTTHSLEAIDIILDDCKHNLDEIAVYHVKNQHKGTTSRRYSGKKLINLRNEIGFDVR